MVIRALPSFTTSPELQRALWGIAAATVANDGGGAWRVLVCDQRASLPACNASCDDQPHERISPAGIEPERVDKIVCFYLYFPRAQGNNPRAAYVPACN